MFDNLFGVASLLVIVVGPALGAAFVAWLLWFRGAPLNARSAVLIFGIGAVCSIGLGLDTTKPAIVALLLTGDLSWLVWMAATGGIVVIIVGLLSRWKRVQSFIIQFQWRILGEIEAALRANNRKRARITFDDGVVQVVDIHSVDDEGFVHRGPNGEPELSLRAEPVGSGFFWTRFGSVVSVEPVERK